MAIWKTYDSMETENVLIREVVKMSSAVVQGAAERVVNVGTELEWCGEW
jgi:hypothetical protein